MHSKQSIIRLLGGALLAAGLVFAQQPDNTKMNKGDGSAGAVTADQQKMNSGDRDLTRKIRRAVVGDKSLSTYAHNVKIISQNGKVTLKGPVRSEDERHDIVSKANDVAGAGNVDDQLSVKPGN
jgi:osmotically-inducible protein OsmY